MKGGHDVHLSKKRDNLGDEYGLSGRHVVRLMRVNQCLPEIKEMLDQGKIQLTAAVQLSYLPEQGQRMALEVSEKSGTNITEKVAKEIRKAKMTEKDIWEAIAGPDPEISKLTGEPILSEEKPKPIRLSGDIRAKYFSDTPQKEVEDISTRLLLHGSRNGGDRMFDTEQLKAIDSRYFNIITVDEYDVTI